VRREVIGDRQNSQGATAEGVLRRPIRLPQIAIRGNSDGYLMIRDFAAIHKEEL
jgi:hypothetical protein